MSWFLKAMVGAAQDAMGFGEERVKSIARLFGGAVSDVRDSMPKGCSSVSHYHVARCLFGVLVNRHFGDVIDGRVGRVVADQYRYASNSDVDSTLAFMRHVEQAARAGCQYSGVPWTSSEAGRMYLYCTVKLGLADNGLDDTDMAMVNEVVLALEPRLREWSKGLSTMVHTR